MLRENWWNKSTELLIKSCVRNKSFKEKGTNKSNRKAAPIMEFLKQSDKSLVYRFIYYG